MPKYDDFITVLSDFINKRETEINITEDLKKYASLHSVTGIFIQQLEKKEVVQSYCMKYVISYLQRLSLEKEIGNILSNSKQDYFFIKGTAVAAYYPVPALRSMGDSDLVVKDRQVVKKILEENGFVFTRSDTSDWKFEKNGVNFELHNQLLYGNLLNPQKHLEYFNDCWKYVSDNTISWNFHFLYLIEHLRKHLVWEGVGFRQFMDIAVMIKYGNDLFDWNWIREQLYLLDMDGFTDVCFSLIKRWFDIALPYDVPEATDEVYDFASLKILENGVFGFAGDKYKNEEEREIYVTQTNNDSYQFTVIKRFVNRLFPGYDELVAWPQYSFLKGRKYLLPICWIYRLLRGILKPEKMKKNVNWSKMSKEQYSRYNEELSKWGL